MKQLSAMGNRRHYYRNNNVAAAAAAAAVSRMQQGSIEQQNPQQQSNPQQQQQQQAPILNRMPSSNPTLVTHPPLQSNSNPMSNQRGHYDLENNDMLNNMNLPVNNSNMNPNFMHPGKLPYNMYLF